ncbi:MAG: sensor histidine kinase, partial [Gemmataceae bacterium]
PNDNNPLHKRAIFIRYGRAFIAPAIIWLLLLAILVQPITQWLNGDEVYDRAALQEWIEEARISDSTLSDLVLDYYRKVKKYLELAKPNESALPDEEAFGRDAGSSNPSLRRLDLAERLAVAREDLFQHMKAIAEPPTKMYPGQMPLFPSIFRMEVCFLFFPKDWQDRSIIGGIPVSSPVVWESGLRSSSGQIQESHIPVRVTREKGESMELAVIKLSYQLRAWSKKKKDEEEKTRRLKQLLLLAMGATVFGVGWAMALHAHEMETDRSREKDRLLVERAEDERRRAESNRLETEKALLAQNLATQLAEQKNLEIRSHFYASVGIMAGSYAHNIKNLLVRPNDLIRRCLETPGMSEESRHRLEEVRLTLAQVTERLQQILRTVSRDPAATDWKSIDLNSVARHVWLTWKEVASDRWQTEFVLENWPTPLSIQGDSSNLHQAVENLVFNARDATFEKRNQLRELVLSNRQFSKEQKKAGLIEAASWKGVITMRCYLQRSRENDLAVIEVVDNGIGIAEETRARCTETFFSTKRDNSLYIGNQTGMGLGLAFVMAIMETHRGQFEIESDPGRGTVFRLIFPFYGEKLEEPLPKKHG